MQSSNVWDDDIYLVQTTKTKTKDSLQAKKLKSYKTKEAVVK